MKMVFIIQLYLGNNTLFFSDKRQEAKNIKNVSMTKNESFYNN